MNKASNSTQKILKKAVIKGQRFLKKHSPLIFPASEGVPKVEVKDPIIAVDAMGGDYAPGEIVKGAVRAARELGIRVRLVGPQDLLSPELRKYETRGLPIELVPCADYIRMDEKQPASAVKRQKDSSIMVAMDQVTSGQAHAVVSAGSTGAAVAAALFQLKRLSGIERPAIAVLLPTQRGDIVLVDAGANVDSTPYQIAQHAIMGSVFAQQILNLENPRVGLLSIGEEQGKGNKITKDTYELLNSLKDLNFIGNVEGRTLSEHHCEVIVCDGFVGNVFLKCAEGAVKMALQILAQELTASMDVKMGALMCKPAFRRLKNERLNPAKHGGAVLLGVGGTTIIAHGNSNDFAIMNAIRMGAEAVESNVTAKIHLALENEQL